MRSIFGYIVAALILVLVAARVSRAQDPALPDSVIIEDIVVELGDSEAIVPIYARTDDHVAFFNLPISYRAPEGGFHFGRVDIISGYLSEWDEVFYEFLPDDGYLRLFGIWDTGDEDNPVLNTDDERVHILDLVLNIDQGTPDQFVAIESATDPVGGPVLLGLNDGVTEFSPAFVGGVIRYGNPTGVENHDIAKPATFSLKQNYPNPFNPETIIEFELQEGSLTNLTIYNLLGQHVVELADGYHQAGSHSVVWDGKDERGRNVPSGIYFCSLSSNNRTAISKMLLIR
jgi:hypothetical protein